MVYGQYRRTHREDNLCARMRMHHGQPPNWRVRRGSNCRLSSDPPVPAAVGIPSVPTKLPARPRLIVMTTPIELTPAIVDRLTALTRYGSPYSKNAAVALLDGRTPTSAELNSLLEVITRGSRPLRRVRPNDNRTAR